MCHRLITRIWRKGIMALIIIIFKSTYVSESMWLWNTFVLPYFKYYTLSCHKIINKKINMLLINKTTPTTFIDKFRKLTQ